ncbi:unnamed protein product, partial [Prorocentrum cordatum]
DHIPWAGLREEAARMGLSPGPAEAPFSPLEDSDVCDRAEFGEWRNWSKEERAAAREWFEGNMRVYVLNLPSDEERWERCFAALSAQRLRATRVFGVDMRNPGALETAKASGWMPSSFNYTRAQEVAAEPRQRMEGSILGTLGCASAHFKAQAQALEEGARLALVLEDDSLPEPDLVERLWALVREELPCDWQVASLMSRCPYGKCVSRHLLRVQPDGNEPAWGCRHGVNWGMHPCSTAPTPSRRCSASGSRACSTKRRRAASTWTWRWPPSPTRSRTTRCPRARGRASSGRAMGTRRAGTSTWTSPPRPRRR